MKKRIDYYDIAKGVGLLLIIIGHSSLVQSHNLTMNFIYLFHVPIFFLISGILFKQEKNSVKIKKLLKKILVPYLITCVLIITISALYEICRGNYHEALLTVKTWGISSLLGSGLEDLYGFRHIGAIWYILAYFFASIILNNLLKLKYAYIYVLSLFLIGIFSTKISFLPFSIQSALSGVFYMYIGTLVKKYDLLPRTNRALFYLISLFSGIAVAYCFDTMILAKNSFPGGIMSIGASIILSMTLINVSKVLSKNKAINKSLSFLSINSIHIMCLHTIYLDLFKNKINSFFHCQLISLMVMILFPLIIVIAVDWIKKKNGKLSKIIHST